jgi:hypothetical protein
LWGGGGFVGGGCGVFGWVVWVFGGGGGGGGVTRVHLLHGPTGQEQRATWMWGGGGGLLHPALMVCMSRRCELTPPSLYGLATGEASAAQPALGPAQPQKEPSAVAPGPAGVPGVTALGGPSPPVPAEGGNATGRSGGWLWGGWSGGWLWDGW